MEGLAPSTRKALGLVGAELDIPERDLFPSRCYTKHDALKSLKIAICLLVFPILGFLTLIWSVLGNVIIEGQLMGPSKKKPTPTSDESISSDPKWGKVTFHSANRVKLDGIIHKHDSDTNRFVVFLCGSQDTWQNNKDHIESISNIFKANVFSVNYRGVGDSSKRAALSDNDLYRDASAPIEALLKAGVDARNIHIVGHSLGGMIGSEVFAKYNESGIKLGGLVIDRSPDSLKDGFSKHTTSCILRLIGKFAFSLTDWSLSIPYDRLMKIGRFRQFCAYGDALSPPERIPKRRQMQVIALSSTEPHNSHNLRWYDFDPKSQNAIKDAADALIKEAESA